MATNLCPKCNGLLVHRTRGTVAIDQCLKCRAVVLDDGELEDLIEREARCRRRDDGLFSDSALLPVSLKREGNGAGDLGADDPRIAVGGRSTGQPIPVARYDVRVATLYGYPSTG